MYTLVDIFLSLVLDFESRSPRCSPLSRLPLQHLYFRILD
jgi:hypothetical protein